jgi:HMG (high mobility group) box
MSAVEKLSSNGGELQTERSASPLNLDHWKEYDLDVSDINDIEALRGSIVPPPPICETVSKKRPQAPTVSRRKKKPKGMCIKRKCCSFVESGENAIAYLDLQIFSFGGCHIHQGMPKRPLSAYNVFFRQERVRVLEEQQLKQQGDYDSSAVCDKLFEELGKIVGKRWKALPDVERRKYERLANEDSVRYRNEMDAFQENKRKKREDEKKRDELEAAPTSLPCLSSLASMLIPQVAMNRLLELDNPIPPGTEVVIPDSDGRERRYRVRYEFYTTTMKVAKSWMENLRPSPFAPAAAAAVEQTSISSSSGDTQHTGVT